MRTGNENNQSSMISNDLESSTIRVMRTIEQARIFDAASSFN